MQPASTKEQALFFLVALPILIFDQLTKYYIIQTVPLNTSVAPIESLYPYLQWSHIANTGATFGMFQGASSVFTILVTIVSIGILVFSWTLPAISGKLRVALGLIFGGAIGNLIDRLLIGHVTDFVHIDLSSIIDVFFANWYVFNVADAAVVAGTIIMAYLTIFDPDYVTREIPTPTPEAASTTTSEVSNSE